MWVRAVQRLDVLCADRVKGVQDESSDACGSSVTDIFLFKEGSIICTSSVLQKKDLSGCAKGLLTLLAASDTCATLVATTDLTRHSCGFV